jgi:cysteine desulfurase
MDPRVKKAMDNFFIKEFGNPSSLYKEGRNAKKSIELARIEIAKLINSKPEEIIFTNGGTESDNLAIFGVAESVAGLAPLRTVPPTPRLWRAGITENSTGTKSRDSRSKPHIITTKIEHHAVLNPCKFLEKQGWKITYLDVGEDGIVDPRDVVKALRPDTVLVSIMYANNEIGTVQPIIEIGKILKKHKAIFHTDACQASAYLDLDVNKLGVDLMTINGSKMYGPKGIGFLYVKRGVKIAPIMYGGGQERGLRPGTENVPSIIGLAEALKIVQKERIKESKRLASLRDYFIERLKKEIPKTFLNGHPSERLPNNVNVSILDVEGEAVLLYLDELGVSCSTGSACSSADLEPSHVIMALNKNYAYSHGSLRFSLGRINTKKDIDYVMKILPGIIKKLRSISAINIKK